MKHNPWPPPIVAASLMALSLTAACSKTSIPFGGSAASSASASDEKIPPSSIGVKNYDQINATMATLVGVTAFTQATDSTYNAIQSQLPSTNILASFNSNTQTAVTKLAVRYCEVMINDATVDPGTGLTKRSSSWPGVDFTTSAPTVAFATRDSRNTIAKQTIDRFWGVGVGNAKVREEAEQEIVSLLEDLASDLRTDADILANSSKLTQNNPAQTRAIMQGICAAALASSSTTVF